MIKVLIVDDNDYDKTQVIIKLLKNLKKYLRMILLK